MSYNIGFYIKVDGADEYWLIGRPDFDSPTYNLGKMFRLCMDWDFKQDEFYTCDFVFERVNHGMVELIKEEHIYREYNSPNGWGTTENAYATLKSIDAKLREISERIPLKYVWMRWG